MRNFKISQKILKNIKGEKVMDVITDFLRSEIDTKEHYEKIIHFITSYEIRKGKFKGNKYIIEKINRDSFILYIEYQDIQGKIIYTPSIAPIISQNRLIEFIEEYIKKLRDFKNYYVSRKNFFLLLLLIVENSYLMKWG